MTLLGKLTLSSSLSKVAIVLLFIVVLPFLIDQVAFRSTNRLLQKQEKQVFNNIRQNGMDYYLQGDSSYGSYTLLKEEYISLERIDSILMPDTIMSAQRVIENDTAIYRILQRNFEYDHQLYSLEIGKTLNAIRQYNGPLQRIALLVLGSLILFTLLTDLFFTRLLLQPLKKIIRSKVQHTVFPFREVPPPIVTTTTDFANLDRLLSELMHRINDDFNREREFASNASHELMTPIGILQTKMENLLLREDLDPSVEDKLVGMMKTLQRLKKITQSLLLIARIENDQYGRSDTVRVHETIADILEELQLAIEDKNITCNMNVSDTAVLTKVNKDLLRQLLYNIIHNSIRYNKPAGTLNIFDKANEAGQYLLYISDTGEGMATDDIHHLFERFRKKNPGSEGYGLGLSIVKAIADYHRCSIDIKSKPDEGTTMILQFPGNRD